MNGTLKLKNYRCFSWDYPIALDFSQGFTAFVGSNNSGKSTVLRAVYELRPYLENLGCTVWAANGFHIGASPQGVTDIQEVANEADPSGFEFSIEVDADRPMDGQPAIAKSLVCNYNARTGNVIARRGQILTSRGELLPFSETQIRSAPNQGQNKIIRMSEGNLTVDYGPLLTFATELAGSRYFPAFRNAINEGSGNYYDLPVGTSLVATWDSWKAGPSKSHKRAIARVEKEIAELLGFQNLEINAEQSGKTLDVNIDGRPHKLYEVGSGVAQLIIVLAAALVSRPPYILIDEPELSLHPSLQLKFLSTLGSYSTRGVLYATHHLGLARSTTPKIFVVKRINQTTSSLVPHGAQPESYAELLGELNYSSRVELGCEGILLVEGATDVLCFQEFLRQIGLDQKYVVLSLGGSQLIRTGSSQQLAELTRIVDTRKIRAFIDSERSEENAGLSKGRQDFVNECAALNINVHVSNRRAIENYFEAKGISKALGDPYVPIGHFDKLKDARYGWAKADNWRIARATNLSDIEGTDFGEFIYSLRI